MTGLTATLALDFRVQRKSKLFAIALGTAGFTGILSRLLIGPQYAAVGAPIAYLFVLCGTTYLFGPALLLLEKAQGTLHALRTSPLSAPAYLTSKVVTLTGVAVLEGIVIHGIAFSQVPFDPLPILLGVVLLGVMNTLIGLGQVASHHSVLSFLMPGGLVVSSIQIWPFLGVLEIGPPWVWYLIPSQGPFLLIQAGFVSLADWQWGYALLSSGFWIGSAAWWTSRRFHRHIGLGKAAS